MLARYKIVDISPFSSTRIIGKYHPDGNIYETFYEGALAEYDEWLAAGNVPEPMDPPPPPVPIPPSQSERIEALETMLSMVLDQEAGL